MATQSSMIKCPKCKALNTKESIVCGSCGTKLPKHEGIRPVNLSCKEKQTLSKSEILEIVLCVLFLLIYVIVFNKFINAILGCIALFLARKRNSVTLEVIAWLGIGLFLGDVLLYAILVGWGFA